MTSTTIVATDKATYEAMIERAEAQTQVNTKEIAQIQARLASIDAELSTLQQRAIARHQLLSTSTNTLTTARTRASDLETQLVMSEGTAVHADLMKEEREHKKRLARIEKEHADLHTRLTTENQTDTEKGSTLKTEREELSNRLSFLMDQNIQLATGKTQAFSAIGELEYQEVQAEICEVKARIAERNQQNEDDQALIRSLVDDGVSRLASWPHHARVVKQELPYEDATTRIIESCMLYLEQLQKDALQLRVNLPLASVTGYGTWWQLLCVDRVNMFAHYNLTSPQAQQNLQQQEQQLSQVLSEYREVSTR